MSRMPGMFQGPGPARAPAAGPWGGGGGGGGGGGIKKTQDHQKQETVWVMNGHS